jgi:flotillin
MLTGVLPEVVRAASEPIGHADRITVISTDGASQLARSVATNVEQGLAIGSDLTGVDLHALFRGLAARQAPAPAVAEPKAPTPAEGDNGSGGRPPAAGA